MPKRRRLSNASVALAASALFAAALALAGCASSRPATSGPAPTPGEVYRSLLGHNEGLTAVRAVVEVSLSFAGREVSLPGVLLLDSFGGFRLDLLDPLDRPLAMIFVDDGRIIHYRPAQGLGASLGVFPADCRSVDPADWVVAILASSIVPVAGEHLSDRGLWGGERVLQRHRGAELHQSISYRGGDARPLPRQLSWYCGDEAVLHLRLREWVSGTSWRLPSRFEIEYPKAGLAIGVELREIEGNPPPTGQPFKPRLGPEIRWTSWVLPQ